MAGFRYLDLSHHNNKPTNNSPVIQVTIALYVSFALVHLRVVGDLQGISVAASWQVIHRVARARASKRRPLYTGHSIEPICLL